MNQILQIKNSPNTISYSSEISDELFPYIEEKKRFNYIFPHIYLSKSKKIKLLKSAFIVSIFIIVISLFVLFLNQQSRKKSEKESLKLLSSYQLTSLYAKNEDYVSIPISNTTSSYDVNPFVIGVIQIDKIRINYPILSYLNDENLKIAPCKIAGPMPNEVGNLCIAAHNYVDFKFFSRLDELTIGDTLFIYDLKGNYLEYVVSHKTEVEDDDLSIVDQNTDGKIKITLITCNNVKGTRIVVQAETK